MRTEVQSGNYTVAKAMLLAIAFKIQQFINVTVDEPKDKNRETQSGKPATAHWMSLFIENRSGEIVIVDALQLIKQACSDLALRDACFDTFDANFVNDELVVGPDTNFKETITVGLKNKKFYV